MATINCPQCSETLSSYLIDVIEGGGHLAGAGGLTCPNCGTNIPHSQLERLVHEAPFKSQSGAEGKGCSLFLFLIVSSTCTALAIWT